MKKQILSVVVTLGVIITLSVAGFAGLEQRLNAKIPFDFNVGGKTLSAGRYIVQPGTTTFTLIIRNAETKEAVAIMTQNCDVAADSKPKLVFHRYGNQYFLAKALGNTAGSELMKSKEERKAAAKGDQLAMNDVEVVTVSAQVGQ